MAAQTDEDRLSGILRLRFGSVEKEVPALPLRPAREWVEMLRAKLAEVATASSSSDDDVLWRLASTMTDSAVELVIAYDRAGAIGDAEWLHENATPYQLKAAFEVMREEALPFDDEVKLMNLIALAAQSAARSSTNGLPNTGASDLVPLNRSGRRASSRSTGKRAKSA